MLFHLIYRQLAKTMRAICVFIAIGAVTLLCRGDAVRDSDWEDAVVEVEGEQFEQAEVKQVEGWLRKYFNI